MSDLQGGGPSASGGTGRGNGNGSSRMPQAAPIPTGSPGRIRGPVDIMRDRVQREARKKAEQEAVEMERARAEEEQRLVEEDRRRRAEKRAAAAGAAGDRGSGGDAGYRSSGSAPAAGQRISDNSQRSGERTSGGEPASRPPGAPISGRGRGGTAVGGGEASATNRPRPNVAPPAARPVPPSGRTGATQTQAGPSGVVPPAQPASQPTGEPSSRRPTQSTFPHAFERWETLSSHWEGLTSFWIRRLEENSSEIQRDPLSSQLSRQVTDLSAAGANLFHAVVELQRLRASSERKFQRWFFETRTEQERAQEMQAQLEAVLAEERRGRADAIADAVARESEKSNSDKLVAEMKRELQISKEEARRAWEELGRREQEERERTLSLREGQPTIVGGVQVVPMMQGVPSRHGSTAARPTTRDGRTYDPGPVGNDTERASGNDPFITNASSSMPTYASAPAVQPATTSSAFYQQHQGTTLHPTNPTGSEGTYSEGDIEYEIDPSGDFRRDSRGQKIPYSTGVASDDDTDEFEASERAREIAHLQQYGHAPVTTAGGYASTSASGSATAGAGRGGTDYSGQGYGSGPGWEEVPRHHHPTRLSDVLEEDEHSRTSTSMVSRSRD